MTKGASGGPWLTESGAVGAVNSKETDAKETSPDTRSNWNDVGAYFDTEVKTEYEALGGVTFH